MKKFIHALCIALFAAASVHAAPARTNFVFFLVDDLGWGDLGCYGSRFHETPNLDRLAGEGMKFTNAYSACTVCSPSRAAILTGRYPGRLHLTDWIAGHGRKNPQLKIPEWKMKMDHDLTTLPEALKEGGYRTQFIGKWHLMPIGQPDFKQHQPENHGFDGNVAGREWGQPKGPGKYFSPFGMPNLDDGEKGDFLTDRLTDAAVEFIDKARDEPFLLYLSYYTVHGPIMAKPEMLAKYQAKAKGFDNRRGENLNPAYAGMVESLDQSVGRVLQKIEQAGLADSTVVIFTADNGGVSQKSSGGLRGAKALAYEGGTREPTLIKWPGKVAAGTVCDTPVIGTDFYPTILEMAGLPAQSEAHVDGLSLVPLLTEKTDTLGRDALFWHYPHYHRTPPYGAIRQGDLKLIEFFEDGKLELYDLKSDPAESHDLAASQPENARRLLAALRDWRSSVGAQMPTPNPDYDPHAKPAQKKPRAERKPKVERQVFLVSGDPQYLAEKSESPARLDPYSEEANRRFIELVKSFPGTKIPDNFGGGEVGRDILGVLVAGDLIDSADKDGGYYPAMQRFEWARYKADYGLSGKDGGLPFPIYELHGNHDGPQADTFIIDGIIERNKTRPGLANVSANGLHYSWDWGPLHLVNLGMFVGAGEQRRKDHHYAPKSSLEFLVRDLAEHVGDSGRPLVLSFHLHPNGAEFDWPREDLASLMSTIRGHNVVALFHGHTHGSPPSRLQWNGTQFARELPRGIDVFNPDDSGAAKTDPRNPGEAVGIKHGFLYVELIDREGDDNDEFVVRSIATDDNWASHRWDQEWRKQVSIPE